MFLPPSNPSFSSPPRLVALFLLPTIPMMPKFNHGSTKTTFPSLSVRVLTVQTNSQASPYHPQLVAAQSRLTGPKCSSCFLQWMSQQWAGPNESHRNHGALSVQNSSTETTSRDFGATPLLARMQRSRQGVSRLKSMGLLRSFWRRSTFSPRRLRSGCSVVAS